MSILSALFTRGSTSQQEPQIFIGEFGGGPNPSQAPGVDAGDRPKVSLSDLRGGLRVLQLWEDLKRKRQAAKEFKSSEFTEDVCDFVFRSMDALEHGHPVIPPKPPGPVLPRWARPDYFPQYGSSEDKKRKLKGRGWSIEDIEKMNPIYYDKVLQWGWTEKEILADIALQAEKQEAIKRRWPNR